MDTIKIMMPIEDVPVIEKIFQRTDLPSFTIISWNRLEDTSVAVVELSVDSTLSLWFLAKSVEMEQNYDRQWQKTKEKVKKIVEETRNKISNNG